MGLIIGKRAAGEVRILPLAVSGEVRAGESLCATLLTAARSLGLRFQDGDILVVKHKVVSKAEGALVALDEIRPSAASKVWARRYGLDARVSELAVRESRRIVRRKRGVLITETKHGFVCATVVSDSFGRPWREGLTEVAIGVAGMRPLVDYRGLRDPHGYSLHATLDAVADELACAAGLVCGKLAGTPACIIRGYAYIRENRRGSGGARQLLRPAQSDLFR
jgi:coenzyme F420-0:L-glutamate ligase / coenzyme F420-1:gamma-L-glutamate ligase